MKKKRISIAVRNGPEHESMIIGSYYKMKKLGQKKGTSTDDVPFLLCIILFASASQ